MKSKNVIVFLVIIFGLFGLMWWGKTASTGATPVDGVGASGTSVLSAAETLYDFGTISMKDGNVSTTFLVSNTSAGDINLKTVTTSCMCTTAFLIGPTGEKGPFGMPGHGGAVRPANELVKAGETREIKVVYDPNAHGPAGVGPVDRFIYLKSADGGTLELEIKALVTP